MPRQIQKDKQTTGGQAISAPAHGVVRDGVHHFALRVYYEDTDFSGAVYHASYLRYAERARSDFLHLCGVKHKALWARRPSLAFVVARMDMRFLAMAGIDDVLEIRTAFRAVGRASVRMEQAIYRADTRIWKSTCVVACVMAKQDTNNTALAPLPVAIRNTIHRCVSETPV